MKLTLEQVSHHLKTTLLPCYWISGDEILLRNECFDKIKSTLTKQGFSERRVFFSNTSTFAELANCGRERSLFAEKTILECHLSHGKLNKEQAGIIADLLTTLDKHHVTNVLLMVSPKLESNVRSSKYYKSLEAVSAHIEVWPLTDKQFSFWLTQRLSRFELTTDHAGLALITHNTQGNLLAASQLIELLSLQYGATQLTYQQIKDCVHYHAQFDIFGLCDIILSGNTEKSLLALQTIQMQNGPLPLLLWAIAKDCRALNSAANHWLKMGIFTKRHPLLQQAQQRLSKNNIQSALQNIAVIDQKIKGQIPGCPWQALSYLIQQLTLNHNYQTVITL